ncbi:MAG TPA: GNAT family N-acetyltransferase [Solirubrobacteraceae bacterium]
MSAEELVAASHLFDSPATTEWAQRFLNAHGHHLLMAWVGEEAAGFVSGVETTHPDKGTEMFLYELSVDEGARRRGIGARLVQELAELARERGCYGMWTGTEADNVAARRTYARAGATLVPVHAFVEWSFRRVGTGG